MLRIIATLLLFTGVGYGASDSKWGFCHAGLAYATKPVVTQVCIDIPRQYPKPYPKPLPKPYPRLPQRPVLLKAEFTPDIDQVAIAMPRPIPLCRIKHNKVSGKRKPNADWLCKLPTAKETKEAATGNSNRCKNGQQEQCEVGAGGNKDLPWADLNVPRGAWYHIPGTTAGYLHVRCECGCFTGNVKLLTLNGYESIENLAGKTTNLNPQLVTYDQNMSLKSGYPLSSRDFVVGPEEDYILTIATESTTIELTNNHPVMTRLEGKDIMVQANQLKEGDHLIDLLGRETVIVSIERFHLPPDNNLVYNVDTKDSSESGHVIIANGLQMGDKHWQSKLSERQNRIQNFIDGE